MTVKLTPAILAAAYDLLAETEPFQGWNLPGSDDVVFVVDRSLKTRGWFMPAPLRIGISERCVGHLETLLEVLAHEMTHLHEHRVGAATSAQHTRAFREWAMQVCGAHGFDPVSFI